MSFSPVRTCSPTPSSPVHSSAESQAHDSQDAIQPSQPISPIQAPISAPISAPATTPTLPPISQASISPASCFTTPATSAAPSTATSAATSAATTPATSPSSKSTLSKSLTAPKSPVSKSPTVSTSTVSTSTPKSLIPRPTRAGSKMQTKRRTRVSDIISRLSSSTASSRAKAESSKEAAKAAISSPTLEDPATFARPGIASVFRSRPAKASSPVATPANSPANVSNVPATPADVVNSPLQPQTSAERSARSVSGHGRENSEESAVFFPRVDAAPPRTVARPSSRNSKTRPGSSASLSSGPSSSSRRQSTDPRLGNGLRLQTSPTPASRNTSYSGPSASSPPTAPQPQPPAPRVKSRVGSASPTTSRPGSAAGMRRVRRPGSRAGTSYGSSGAMTPSASTRRLQSSRVEELKFKITELEEVLQQERHDRVSTSWVDQVRILEAALKRERHDKDLLASRLRQLEAGGSGPSNFIVMPSSPDASISENETLADEDRQRFSVSKIPELEAVTEHAETDEATAQLVALQTEISYLKSDSKTLGHEKANYQKVIRGQEEQLKANQAHVAKLEHDLRVKSDLFDAQELELAELKGRCLGAEKLLSTKEAMLRDKIDEVEELKGQLRNERVVAQEALDGVERVKSERDELQRQLYGFQTSRRQSEKQMSTLERDNRRSKRIINALETSMQDLKVSLEEKAMENDELARSIVKVMEQASETIEGAKRHSMLMTGGSPLIGSSPSIGARSPPTSSGPFDSSPRAVTE